LHQAGVLIYHKYMYSISVNCEYHNSEFNVYSVCQFINNKYICSTPAKLSEQLFMHLCALPEGYTCLMKDFD